MLVGSPTNANIDCNGGVRQNPSAQTDDSCRTVSRIYSGTGSGRQRADSKVTDRWAGNRQQARSRQREGRRADRESGTGQQTDRQGLDVGRAVRQAKGR